VSRFLVELEGRVHYGKRFLYLRVLGQITYRGGPLSDIDLNLGEISRVSTSRAAIKNFTCFLMFPYLVYTSELDRSCVLAPSVKL
jgi:hypothetical protein